MNANACALAPAQEPPIMRANQRAMSAMNETEKLVQELEDRIKAVLRPRCPVISEGGTAPNQLKPGRDVASPLADGTNDRAAQIESTNAILRDIISRIEL